MKKNNMRTPKEKEKILKEFYLGKLGRNEICRKYNISTKTLAEWRIKYKKFGIDGLKSNTGKSKGGNKGLGVKKGKTNEENFRTVLNEFLIEFDKFEEKLRNDLESNVYENIYLYPNKGIHSSLKTIGLSFEAYLNWIKVSLEDDEEFRKIIITEIFDGFMYDRRYTKLTPKKKSQDI